MNSRWQANKIGLVNFWYYDEQEFSFAKGRMLLRGSNGSGKSVTMQSVVPLLLDGNVSPERLDPFGTRDRKMSNYLLEEDDGREERTGYLYLEFKRKESDTYLTIGMGMRARRGKPLDKWYFAISDGRRIGKDFWLYKQTNEKITLSKKELENRIADGGKVFERQLDYMEYVNNHIFGFETLDEYKEMIDLLLQLRTPKLSKDFKPSVINEILSNSLQPLSDEELRPMSEAIENMDMMSMNLKAREAASQAAEKINRVFDRYNKYVLYKKASDLEKVKTRKNELLKEEKDKANQIKQCSERVLQLERELEDMEAKNISMQKERESLNKSDAVNLKTREAELEQQIQEHEIKLKEKEKYLEIKNDRYLDIENRKKEGEDKKYTKECEIHELLEEMSDEAEDMSFEEHGFFSEELIRDLDKEYQFDTLKKQFDETKAKIDRGLEILQETNLLDRQADDLTKRWEQTGRELDGVQKRQIELEALLVQTQNEWKEAFYNWNSTNKELCIDKDKLNELSRFADDYDEKSDFAQLRGQVGEIYLGQRMELGARLDENRKLLEDKNQEYNDVKQQLEEWENKKEPQPVRSEAVCNNRKRLDELGIPYQEFYKVIEFGSDLDEDAQNHLEEALLQMGILDAIIVDEQYRGQVLKTAPGCEDKYLFTGEKREEHSLLEVLELNDEINDIFSNQRITGILSSISYKDESILSVSESGVYKMGVLTGTVTGDYTAQFMGTKAREKARLARIDECKSAMKLLEQEIKNLEDEFEILGKRRELLKSEYESLPDDEDMREALKLLQSALQESERVRQEQMRLEEELRELKEKIRSKKEEAFILAKALYLDCTYNVFMQASKASQEYNENLIRLKSNHDVYLHSVQNLRTLSEELENIDSDMEQIRYDIGLAQRNLGKCREEFISVEEQLKLTDYTQIKERLDACIKWINEYPSHMKKCVKEKTENEEKVKLLEEQLAECVGYLKECEEKGEYLGRCYSAEVELDYVELPEEIREKSDKVCGYLETEVSGWDLNGIVNKLNQVYFENRAFLNEYQLTQIELFQDLDNEKSSDDILVKRQDIIARYQGVKIPFVKLLGHLEEDIAQLKDLIKAGDRELFEDILANTVSRKIRSKINASAAWVEKMNKLMSGMNTSSGLKLSLRWRSKTAENEEQLDTKELVNLLKKDYRLMSEEEALRLSTHFRSKVEEARRHSKESGGMISFYQVMKDTLDYRKWFEFQLFSQKTGERQKELTNSVFGTFSGGEKAMSMYVPLFSAVVAKYQGGRQDAPRLISLDEAFAGVDNRNIRDMFRLMTEFSFDFIINSQVLWGDCDTLDALAIYQLQRPKNAKFVTVMPYLWNGHIKELLENEEMVEIRSMELG